MSKFRSVFFELFFGVVVDEYIDISHDGIYVSLVVYEINRNLVWEKPGSDGEILVGWLLRLRKDLSLGSRFKFNYFYLLILFLG